MNRARVILKLIAGLATIFTSEAALTQVNRATACIQANDAITAARLGKDRKGASVRLDLAKAVAIGVGNEKNCRGDDGFSLAYALARIDFAAKPSLGTVDDRRANYAAALVDLQRIQNRVMANQSDHYEIFSILSLIYYNTGNYTGAVAVAQAAMPLFPKLAPASRQKTLVNKAMAEAALGLTRDAATSFDLATHYGHPTAQAIKYKMLGVP